MALLGMLSMKISRILEGDGVTEQIIGDEVANNLLRRESWKGWEYLQA